MSKTVTITYIVRTLYAFFCQGFLLENHERKNSKSENILIGILELLIWKWVRLQYPQINQRLYLAPENYYIKILEGAVNYNKGSCRKTIVSTDKLTDRPRNFCGHTTNSNIKCFSLYAET